MHRLLFYNTFPSRDNSKAVGVRVRVRLHSPGCFNYFVVDETRSIREALPRRLCRGVLPVFDLNCRTQSTFCCLPRATTVYTMTPIPRRAPSSAPAAERTFLRSAHLRPARRAVPTPTRTAYALTWKTWTSCPVILTLSPFSAPTA